MTPSDPKPNSEKLGTEAWMAASFLADLVVHSDPDKFSQVMTQQMRELTGARTVMLLRHDDHKGCYPLYTCPPRRADMLSPEEAVKFCPSRITEKLPVLIRDFPAGHPLGDLLKSRQVESILLVPLLANGVLIGSVILFDLPEPERIDSLQPLVDFLSPFLGIALQNALSQQAIRDQNATLEEQIKLRTDELNEARLAALNMMEDAVLDKKRLEMTQFALDHASDPSFWIRPDGSIAYANKAACNTLGRTRDELLNLSVKDVDPCFPEEKWPDHWNELRQKGSLDFETLHQKADGTVFPVEIHATYLRHENQEYNFATAHNITNRKQAEQALRKSRKNLQITLNSIGDAVIATDVAGRITLMNPVAEKLTGWTQADAAGHLLNEVFRIINEKTGNTVENPVNSVLKTGQIVGLANHTLLISKDGHETPIADSGAPITNEGGEITGVVLVFRDQTHERAARIALEESEEYFRSTFNDLLVGVVVHAADSSILFSNPQASRMLGLSREQMEGKQAVDPAWHFVNEDLSVMKLEDYPVNRVISTGKNLVGQILGINHPDRNEITWVTVSATPVFTEGNVLKRVIVNFMDITERRNAEKQVEFEQTLFKSFMDAIPAKIYFKDLEGRFVKINKAALIGLREEDIIGKSDADFIPAKEVPPLRQVELDVMQSEQPIQTEEFANGRWHFTTKAPRYDQNGKLAGIFGISWDITDRKNAENQVELEQAMFKSFMDFIPAKIYFKDLKGRLVKTNKAALIGIREEDVIGKSDADFSPPEEVLTLRQVELDVMQSNQPIQIEEFVNGRWYFTTKAPRYDQSRNLAGTFGISWDITDRKNAEKQVEFEQALFKSFMDVIPAKIYFKDLEGRFVKINKAALAGRREEDVIGKSDADFAPAEEVRPFRQVELDIMKSEQPIQIEEFSTGRWYFSTKAPRYDENGKLAGIFGISWDITERKNAEKQIQFQQNLFKSFMDAMPFGIYFKDLEGRFIQVNKALLSGLQDYEVIGKTDADFLPEYQVEKSRLDEQEVMRTGNVLQFEDRQDDRWYFSTKAPRYDENGKLAGIFGISLDITEQKRMQMAIEKQILALTRPLDQGEEIAFDELFNLEEIQRIQDEFAAATGVASIITKTDGTPITRPSNFSCLCNDIIRKTTTGCANCFKSDAAIGRYHPEGPIVQPCLSGGLWDAGVSITVGNRHIANWLIGQVRDETQTDDAMRAYAHMIGADEQKFMEAFYRVPVMSLEHFKQIAQALFTLANQLSTTAYQNIQQARFIADEKRRTEELNRLSTAIKNSPEAIMITDPSGIIQYVNPAFETITGYTPEEALGKTPRILKSGQQDAAVYSNLWKTIKAGKTWEGRLINKRKNGDLYTEEAAISPVRTPDGTVTGYVALKRNITEELLKEEKFRQSQKMEAVGQLAGGVAHDFNNILQAILGFSDILLAAINSQSPEYLHVKEIQKSAQRAAELTRQLLTFSRKQPIAKVKLNLNAAIYDTEVLLKLLLGKHINYVFNPEPELHEVYADRSQVTQIVMNLAVNARDAMPDGGRLTITTKNITFDAQAISTMPDAEPGSFVCLSITDTGAGMSREIKDHLFEPFFTTKEVGRGTGLGLSVVYGIVKQNHGWIHVYSEAGRGSSFNIYLPTHDAAAQNQLAKPAHHERILLVEDEPDMLNVVIQILNKADYETVAVKSAEEALELFAQEKGNFALLFSDITLPGKSGIELADALRAENPKLPVLLYSGYQDPRERWENLELKGYHFLQKPFTLATLLAAVHDALTKRIR